MSEFANSRILPVTRWLVYLIMGLVAAVGACILAVVAVLPFYWSDAVAEMAATKPNVDLGTMVPPLALLFVIGAAVLVLIWMVMRKLLAIIKSVEMSDPFNHANAIRLKAIGWMMVAIQIIGFPLAVAAEKVADHLGENDVGVDVSLNGILAILLVFILAGIFERGAQMREDLEGTV